MSNEYLNNRNFECLIQLFQGHKRMKIKFEYILQDLEQSYERKLEKKGSKPLCCKMLDEKREEYKDVAKRFNEYQDQLAFAFYTLSENIVRYAKFHLIDEQDAIQEGVLICFEKIDRFDPDKGKAFNYMTTCILNHFRQLYRSARNYNELKKRYLKYLQDHFEETVIRNGKIKLNHKNPIDNNKMAV